MVTRHTAREHLPVRSTCLVTRAEVGRWVDGSLLRLRSRPALQRTARDQRPAPAGVVPCRQRTAAAPEMSHRIPTRWNRRRLGYGERRGPAHTPAATANLRPRRGCTAGTGRGLDVRWSVSVVGWEDRASGSLFDGVAGFLDRCGDRCELDGVRVVGDRDRLGVQGRRRCRRSRRALRGSLRWSACRMCSGRWGR